MAAKSTRRRFLKISAIIIGAILILLTGFHLWFKAHARQMIEELVESKSNGKLKMKVGKLKFGYFSKNMELENVTFYNTDTINANTTYRFDVKKIKLRVKSIISVIFQDRFLIDTLTLFDPDIQVTRLKRIERSEEAKSNDVSIPEEMGKIYKSIQDALSVLKVSKFSILNGKFTLNNKILPNQQPVTFSNLDFHIDNFSIDTTQNSNRDKILFSDNVTLSSHHQDIELPDSRHRLSFKDFKINLKSKLVEFDSCTIAASRTDSATSAFTVFFDKLLLTNIDFDTLYKSEVIKADSVYCLNARFSLNVDIAKKKGKDKSPPKLENIIKQLTGDLILDNVVVSNADFNIETVKDGIPNSFAFTNNNFEMQGLTIDKGAANPLKVDRFAMAIRNYENFIKDSTYSIKFDSIIFKDDRISLSNFLFEKLNNGRALNSFRIPQFYLGGLSWDDLVFDQKLKADQATMFYPNITYTVNQQKVRSGQQNIFQSLGAVNEFMDLNYLEVVDGNIDLTIKKDLRLKLKKANLSIESNSLLSSKKIATIKNSLTSINFEKGNLAAGNLDIELAGLRYIGESGHFVADNILVLDKIKKHAFSIYDVEVDKMIVNELNGDIDADGISWKKGTVNLDIANYNKATSQSHINLRNLQGENTTVNILKNELKVSSNVDKISLTKVISEPGEQVELEGLKASGSNLKIKNSNSLFTLDSYEFSDESISTFRQISFINNAVGSKINFSTPLIELTPHIKQLLDKEIILDNVKLEKPHLLLHLDSSSAVENIFPKIIISSLSVTEPKIDFIVNNNRSTAFKWNGSNNPSAFMEIKNFHHNGSSDNKTIVEEVKFYLSDFEFSQNKKKFISKNGNITSTLNSIEFITSKNKPLQWSGSVQKFSARNFTADSINRYNGLLTIKNTDVSNFLISSATISDIKKIVAANKNFQISNFSGSYKDSLNIIQWNNAGFSRTSNTFALDSIAYSPARSRDSFLAQQDFQKDYITFKTGAVTVKDLNPDLLLRENILKANSINIHDAVFTDYKDKQIPFNAGLIKPMPVNLLKKIPLYIDVKNTELINGNVEYTETSTITGEAAVIPVTRLKIKVKNIKNYDFLPADTLDIDATGLLLDKALAHLNVKESYNDVNGGFILQFQVRSADLQVINPVLIPLASVRIESGVLDTLTALVTGRETMATGEMKLYYHDLKIQFLKDGSPKKFKSFLANAFVIKKNNSSRTGQIFFVRKRDRSAINYYVKIIGSGVASSIGARNNKKLLKKYKKENLATFNKKR